MRPDLDQRSSGWPADRVLLAALGVLSWGSVSRNLGPDPDLWGHVRYGLDHLDHGHLLRSDSYNYTAPDTLWINHEWLCELIFGWAWRTAGMLGLWAVAMSLVAVTLGIVLHLAYRSTRGFWTPTLVYVACWFSMSIGFSIRPQLFTFACFAVGLLLVDRVYITRAWPVGWALLLVPLCCVWANLHGGFLVGLALVAYVGFCELARCLRSRCASGRALLTGAVVLLSVAGTLLNPYGFGLWRWLFGALSVSRSDTITEWGHALGHGAQRDLLGFYAMAALAAFTMIVTPLRRNVVQSGLLIATALAAFGQVRHVVIFCVIAAVYLPRHLEAAAPVLARPSSFHPWFRRLAVLFMALAAIGSNVGPGRRPDRLEVPLTEQPFRAFQVIHRLGLSGNLAVEFDWAQAAIWYLGKTCKVAYDGRFRTVYPPEVEADFLAFARGTADWSILLDEHDTELVLMSDRWVGLPLLERRADWVCVYRSPAVGEEHAVLFVRRGRFPELEQQLAAGSLPLPPTRVSFWFGEALSAPAWFPERTCVGKEQVLLPVW